MTVIEKFVIGRRQRKPLIRQIFSSNRSFFRRSGRFELRLAERKMDFDHRTQREIRAASTFDRSTWSIKIPKRAPGMAVEKRQIMREERLESLPAVQIDATLYFGNDPIHCYIVSVTDTGFCVAIPDIEQYEGDPNLTLQVKDSSYAVKLVKQTAHAGGYSYLLQKTDGTAEVKTESIPSVETPAKTKWSLPGYNLVSTFAAMIASGVFATVIGGRMACFNLQKIGDGLTRSRVSVAEVHASGPQPTFAEPITASVETVVTQIDPEIQDTSVPAVSTISSESDSTAPSSEPVASQSSREVEVRPSIDPSGTIDESQSGRPVQVEKRPAIALNLLLDDRKIGRFQDMTKSAYPWLFETGSFDGNLIRASDAARFDLKLFEDGLQDLSAEAASLAISSLQKTLTQARSIDRNARRVPGSPNVYVISSDDADVYFRSAQGRLELVRVLPVDFDGDGQR